MTTTTNIDENAKSIYINPVSYDYTNDINTVDLVNKDKYDEFCEEVAISFKEVQRQYIEGFQEQFIYDLRMKRYLSAKIWKNAIKRRR